jgi:hypothetical protein
MSNEVFPTNLVESFEQWQLLASTAEMSTDMDVKNSVAGIALGQFRKSHLLVNEAIEQTEDAISICLDEQPYGYTLENAESLVRLARMRQSVIELAFRYPKGTYVKRKNEHIVELPPAEGYPASEEIFKEIQASGRELNSEESFLLKQLASHPEVHLAKRHFIEAGFASDSDPAIFTGTINSLIGKFNGIGLKYRIEKLHSANNSKSQRTMGYRFIRTL